MTKTKTPGAFISELECQIDRTKKEIILKEMQIAIIDSMRNAINDMGNLEKLCLNDGKPSSLQR